MIAMGGLYAVISYAVARRTREFGVRIAIGATRWNIAGVVIGHGLRLAGLGMLLGSIIALGLNRISASQVPSLGETPWVLPAIAGALLFLTVAACWWPARRALAVDPLTALRTE